MSSHPCSDNATQPTARLIVLEGMPGAGKTTTAQKLADQGLTVVGEYINSTAETIAISMHPAVGDDNAHQQNWLRKTRQCNAQLAGGATVYVDRDWLSALAYAYSVAGTDSGELLRRRTRWAAAHLRDGSLLLPAIYVVFDLDPATSLARRRARLRPGHSWNQPEALAQLRDFYASPSPAVRQFNPGLAHTLRQPCRIDISGITDPSLTHTRLTELGGPSWHHR